MPWLLEAFFGALHGQHTFSGLRERLRGKTARLAGSKHPKRLHSVDDRNPA